MTITVLGDEKVITQVQRQLEDLVPVVVVERLDKGVRGTSIPILQPLILAKAPTTPVLTSSGTS